jgi:polysaccharide biosynthesis transport protein
MYSGDFMGDKKKQKFSLSDITRKLNESKAGSTAGSTDGQPPKEGSPEKPLSEERHVSRNAATASPPEPPASPAASNLRHGTAINDPTQDRYSPASRYPADVSASGSAIPFMTNNQSTQRAEPNREEETVDFDIMRYVGIIVRRKNLILAALIIASFFSVYTYVKAVKFYTAHARMLFSPGYQDIMGNNQPMYFAWGSRGEKINTHIELLKSETVVKRVLENLNNSIAASAITGGVTINRGMSEGEKNDIIDVAFRHQDAETARNVANELCRTYIEYIKDVSVQDITVLILKLEEQIGKKESALDQKETALRLFKETNRAVELTSQTNVTISKLTQVETAKQQAQLDMLECREKLSGLKKEINQQQVDIIQSITYQNPYQSRLAELELELNALSAEYSPEHYKVRMIRAEIDKIKEAMKSDIVKEAASQTLVKNPIRQSLLQDLITVTIDKSVLDAKRNAQEQISKDLDNDLKKLPAVELQFAQLTRETESLLQVLKLLKTRFEEAKIKRDSQDSDLKILEWAQLPSHAVSNVRFSKILMTLLLGFLIGIGCALLLEFLDQSIKEPQEIERMLELPLLGIVPMIETEKAIIESSGEQGKSVLEPFRALRANLKHIAENNRIKTFIISSAVKGEGKTTLAANIAITFAMDGKKVILVDGDLRRAQMHHLFHLPKKDGLCDYLLGAAEIQDILKNTVHQNLFVITAGEHPQNPAELMGSFRFGVLVGELRNMADIIIFDSPALLPVSDVLSMAPKMDACIMVVRALWTPFKAAQQAKNQLQRIGVRIIGGLLNGISLSRGYYPYYYGYYRYYASKYSYEEGKEPGFSVRKFGIAFESGLKNFFQSIRFSAPYWTSASLRLARRLMRKKTFWILLILAIALSMVDVALLRFIPVLQSRPTITFIGPAPQSKGNNRTRVQITDDSTKKLFEGKPDSVRALENYHYKHSLTLPDSSPQEDKHDGTENK